MRFFVERSDQTLQTVKLTAKHNSDHSFQFSFPKPADFHGVAADGR